MSPTSGVRRAPCPCGEPNPAAYGPCTRSGPCRYAVSHPDLWDHFDDGPFHPREPSPVEVIGRLVDPWTWINLALATTIWAPGAMARAWRRAVR